MIETTPQQLSTFRRIVNFVRFWIHVRANVTVIMANQAAIATALNNSVAHVNRQNARLSWYEHRVPLIAKEYAAFRHHEKKALESVEAQENYAEREKRRAAAETAGSFPSEPVPGPKLEVVSR